MTTQTSAKIICDSVSPAGHRLTTFECTFPRIILAEVNTHRDKSRNSASSRAIPVSIMVKRAFEDPYVPMHWGKNQRGMSAEEDVGKEEAELAARSWQAARDQAAKQVSNLVELGIHKQITNRLLEPFMWHVALISGTEWSNFLNLRDNKDAHPDFRDLAHAMRELYQKENKLLPVNYDEWHLPLVDHDEAFDMLVAHPDVPCERGTYTCKVSVGRCARVSYLTHDGKRDPQADVDLCDRLLSSGHMSPFEHVARPMTQYELDLFKQKKMRWDAEHGKWVWVGAVYEKEVWSDSGMSCLMVGCKPTEPGATVSVRGEHTHFLGNVQGWVQYRKLIPHEEDILGAR